MPPTLSELFDRHHLAIYRYLLKLTSSREDTQDLTQEVFLRAMKAMDSYRESQQERAWLFRIARNLLYDRRRQLQRTPPISSLDDAQAGCAPAQPLRLSLTKALTALPEIEREAFLLAEVAGLSYEEIAAICDASITAVKSRIYRARMTLRSLLDRDRDHEPFLARGTNGRTF